MKKLMLATMVLAFAGMNVQTAKAGDREWATAGKILTGVVAGAVLASAVDAHAGYTVTYSAPAYCPPPPAVVYVPARPVVVAPAPVVCAPPPVIVYREPVCVPRPVVAVSFGYRGHHHGWGHSRHCR
jgi:hypothetical protein